MSHGVEGSIFEAVVLGIKAAYDGNALAPAIDTNAWKIGRLQGEGQAKSPSVVYRRLGGQVEATRQGGVQEYTSPGGDPLYYIADYDSIDSVQVRIKAQDWQQLDCVWAALLTATRTVAGTFAVPGAYDHISEGDDDPSPDAVVGIQEMVQEFTWRMPIPRVISSSQTEIATIAGTTHLIDINPDPGTSGPSITQPLP